MKLTEYAPGIPSKDKKHEIPKLETPKTWEFGVHEHHAEKAGKHFDLRLGDPDTGHAHSWAMRHWPEPGEVRLAVQQPTHTVEYMDFAGEIREGYGKGKVNLARRDKMEVVSSSSGHIRFNVYPGNRVEEYLLRRPKPDSDDWMLHNVTSTRKTEAGLLLPDSKPKYKVKTPEQLKLEDPNTVLQAKIDGAHVLYQFKDTGRQARVLSYRPSARESGVIEHTQRLPDFHEKKVPSALRGSILRGELYAEDKSGKALPSERVGGILNAGVWKSREKQESEGKLVPTVFDVVQWKGKNVSNLPYAEKLELLREATKAAPWLKLPRTAETPEEKKKLFADIDKGKEPSTREGVIEWHLDKPVPVKAKFRPESDAFVKDVFQEKSSRGFAGGFTYSRTPGGPAVGRVGTGMSHELKKDLGENPDRYRGLQALITTTRGHEGRAPAFKSWHLDQELPEGVKMAKVNGQVQPPPQEQPEERSTLQKYAPIAAGLGTAALTGAGLYSAIRKPTFSKNPAIAKMQQASGGRIARAITNNKPESKLRQFADKIMYDADELHYWPKGDKFPRKPKKFDGLVYHADPTMAEAVKGKVNPGLTPAKSRKLEQAIGDDKWKEYQFFEQHAPGSMPETQNLQNILHDAGVNKIPRQKDQQKEVLEGLQARLKGRNANGFIMKETDGFQSGGAFPSEKHDLTDLYADYKRQNLHKDVKALKETDMAGVAFDQKLKALKAHPSYGGRVIDQAVADPSKVIVQKKIPLQKPEGIRGAISDVLTNNPRSKEMRVHVIGGQVMPNLTTPRFDPTSVVMDRDLMHGATAHAQGIMNKMPKEHRGMNFAMDIAPLEGGGYKMIESNPTSNSGLLDWDKNPLSGFQLHKALTGQYSKNVAGAGAVLGGAAAGGAAYLGAKKGLQSRVQGPEDDQA